MPKPKWYILSLDGNWSLIDPQPSINAKFWDVAADHWVNEPQVRLAYFKPKPKTERIWKVEVNAFGNIQVFTILGFQISYEPETLEVLIHRGLYAPTDSKFHYGLEDVPSTTLEMTLRAAKQNLPKALSKLSQWCNKNRYKRRLGERF